MNIYIYAYLYAHEQYRKYLQKKTLKKKQALYCFIYEKELICKNYIFLKIGKCPILKTVISFF